MRAIPHDVAPGQDVTALELNRFGHPLRVRLTADQHLARATGNLAEADRNYREALAIAKRLADSDRPIPSGSATSASPTSGLGYLSSGHWQAGRRREGLP